MTTVDLRTPAALADAERWTAHNYHPLPVVIADAEGAWVTDVDGRRYLDFLAGYSALNFGHRHPGLIAAAHAQLDRVTLTSRAFVHDQFAEFCREPGRAVRQGPGAADEHRRRGGGDRDQGGPQVGLPGQGRAGRAGRTSSSRRTTSTAVRRRSSASPPTRTRGTTSGRTPRASGSCRTATSTRWPTRSTTNTVAVLLEPIQGEAGVLVPPAGYFAGRPRALRPSATCCSSPTRSSPGWAAPGAPSPSSTRASSRTCTCWARRSAAASCRSPRWPRTATCSACCARASTARRSAATRWPARSASRWSGCCATGEFQKRSAELGERLHAGLTALIGQGVVGGPRARAVGRRRHRPGADDRPAGVRAAGRARRAGQGHARLDDPAGAAAGGHRGRAGPRAGPARRPIAGTKAGPLSARTCGWPWWAPRPSPRRAG